MLEGFFLKTGDGARPIFRVKPHSPSVSHIINLSAVLCYCHYCCFVMFVYVCFVSTYLKYQPNHLFYSGAQDSSTT